MSVSRHFGEAQQWAQTHFGGVALGDVRRRQRVCTLAAGWGREPGASIPRLSQGQAYASKAAYQLLGHPQATPDALQAPHRQLVTQQLQAPGTFLLVEDTTELSWPEATERRAGLGPVGAGKATSQGVLLHSLVAAAWPATDAAPTAKRPALPLLGLLDQQFHVRQPVPEAEKTHPPRRLAPTPGPRARIGPVGAEPAGGGPSPGGHALGGGSRPRSRHLRALAAVPDAGPGLCRARGPGPGAGGGGATKEPAGRLFAVARAQPSAGTFTLALRGRPRQPARQVVLQVSFRAPVALRAPQRPGGATGKGEPVPASVGRVWEETGPATAPGLEWLLLSDQPLADLAQALTCVRQYTSRWLIEDFHKALKTGLGAEKLPLQTAARLFAAVALLSLVALALVDLREKSRLEPDLPAEAAELTSTELRVLRHQSRRPLDTVRAVYLALAALGGHLGRTGDGPPGWQTLWLGRRSLRLLVEGVQLAAQLLDD